MLHHTYTPGHLGAMLGGSGGGGGCDGDGDADITNDGATGIGDGAEVVKQQIIW